MENLYKNDIKILTNDVNDKSTLQNTVISNENWYLSQKHSNANFVHNVPIYFYMRVCLRGWVKFSNLNKNTSRRSTEDGCLLS